MFDFNLDGILAGAQWAAATTQLFYGRIEAVVFYATSLLSYYEKLLPMRRPDVLFFVPTTILFYVAYNNQQL